MNAIKTMPNKLQAVLILLLVFMVWSEAAGALLKFLWELFREFLWPYFEVRGALELLTGGLALSIVFGPFGAKKSPQNLRFKAVGLLLVCVVRSLMDVAGAEGDAAGGYMLLTLFKAAVGVFILWVLSREDVVRWLREPAVG